MKMFFDNQSSQYPIVLLPEMILYFLTRELTSNEIASELDISPPIKNSIKRPTAPLDHKHVEQSKTKILTPVGPLWLMLSLVIGVSLFISFSFTDNLSDFFAALFASVIFQTLIAMIAGFKSYEETQVIKIHLTPFEFDKLKKEYNQKMNDYDSEIDRVEKNYKEEYEKYHKTLSDNANIIKSKMFLSNLRPLITATRGGVSPKRGFAEVQLLEKLDVELKGQIFIDMVPKASWSSVQDIYNPDFTFICKETCLHIDIELDEPYTYKEKTPIHYIGSLDDKRNQFFLDNNWCVVRFTEKQVIQQTAECINTINSIHESLLAQKTYFHSELKHEPRWTYEEAFVLQSKGYREGYLK